ncbi:MAG: AzlD domain-containing protein [Rhodospirillales bacterium]|jgi:branched-subunit amino acid transport protein
MSWSPLDAHAAALVGALATYLWRGFGVAMGSRIDPGGRAFAWLSCVAFAVLAALIARLIVYPAGSLAALPTMGRVGAALLAAAIFLLLRRSVLLGCIAGSGAVAALAALA